MARLASWSRYRESIGNRSGSFAAVADLVPVERALYPGSYVDLPPSTAIGSATYVDTDARAARFFADPDRPTPSWARGPGRLRALRPRG